MENEKRILINLLDDEVFSRVQNYLFTHFNYVSGFQRSAPPYHHCKKIQRYSLFFNGIDFISIHDYESKTSNFLIYSAISFKKMHCSIIKDKDYVANFENFLRKTESQISELNKRIGKKNIYFNEQEFNDRYHMELPYLFYFG